MTTVDDRSVRLVDAAQVVHVESGSGYGAIGADVHVFRDRGPVYLLTEHRPPDPVDTAWLLAQPSRMLNADLAVVTFTGRDRELAALTAWRDAATPRLSARWMHAPGGQGKTRLAAQFATESMAAGWKVVRALHGPGQPLPGSQDLRLGGAPGLLLVVDYADRWPVSHLRWLFHNALFHQAVPTRLLLLARSVHTWSAVRAELEELRAETGEFPLGPLGGGTARERVERRAEMFRVARDCLAERYGVPDPTAIEPPLPLSHPGFDLTLTLHMAALTAVDAHVRGLRPPDDMAGLSVYLLDRERKHWTRLYENRLEGLDFATPPSDMARAVFTAALTGPTTHPAGAAALRRVDGKAHHERLLADHAACYPPLAPGSVLEPLYPDRLAEDFVALTLPGHDVPAYAPASWAAPTASALTRRDRDGAPPVHISRAITLLASAAAPDRWPHVAVHLGEILREDPRLALDAGSGALSALADVTSLPVEVLESIHSVLPEERHADLDPGIAALVERLYRHRLALDPAPAERARLHHTLARRHAYAGRYRSAEESVRGAVRIRTLLAAGDPEAYEPDLADSLGNLAVVLSELGRRREALDVAREAVTIRRRLAAADPRAHEPGLARALDNLGIRLVRVGELREGLAASREAVALHRRLAAEGAGADEAVALADSLDNLGAHLSACGHAEEAIATAREAVELWRRLAATVPAAHEPGLGHALNALSNALSEVGRAPDALAAAEEAVALWRRLAADSPAAFEHELVQALGTLGIRLSDVGRHRDAAATSREVVEIYRRLAARAPARYERNLAIMLLNLGGQVYHLGELPEALALTEEAVALWRKLVATEPDANEPGLARTVCNLGVFLRESGRLAEARAAGLEATALHRRLAARHPEAFEPFLANSLDNLGSTLAALGLAADALAAAEEAAAIHRRLATADPDVHEPDLAGSLSNLGQRYAAAGRYQAAVEASDEAVAILRRLATADPAHEASLTKALQAAALLRPAADSAPWPPADS